MSCTLRRRPRTRIPEVGTCSRDEGNSVDVERWVFVVYGRPLRCFSAVSHRFMPLLLSWIAGTRPPPPPSTSFSNDGVFAP